MVNLSLIWFPYFVSVCVESFHVKHPTFSCNMNYLRYVIHGAEGVAFLYDVLYELGSIIRVLVTIIMFAESHEEGCPVWPIYFLLHVGHSSWYVSTFPFDPHCAT